MKKTVKMSLANMQGKLSRAEMKQIMAGYDDGQGCTISVSCNKQQMVSGSVVTVSVGSVSCSGTQCSSDTTSVSCVQSSGQTDTATCPAGSYIG